MDRELRVERGRVRQDGCGQNNERTSQNENLLHLLLCRAQDGFHTPLQGSSTSFFIFLLLTSEVVKGVVVRMRRGRGR